MQSNIKSKKIELYFILTSIIAFFMVNSYAYALSGETCKKCFLGKVNANDLNLRAGPNKNYYAFLQLMKDDILIVLDKKYDWYKVQLPPKIDCYVKADFLDFYEKRVVSRVNNLNIRCKPGLDSTVVGQFKKGEFAYYKSAGSNWVKIYPTQYSYGWVYDKYIDRINSVKKNGVSLYKRHYSYPENIQREVSTLKNNLPKVSGNSKIHTKTSEVSSEKKILTKTKKASDNLQKGKQNKINPENSQKDSAVTDTTAEGYVKDLGVIFYRPGTHKLEDSYGDLLYYLKSFECDLNNYMYGKVRVKGVKEDTVSYYKKPAIRVLEIKYTED